MRKTEVNCTRVLWGVCILVVLGAACCRVDAATILIDKNRFGNAVGDGNSWGSAFKTVNDGMAAAETGDELWVARGTYPELLSLKAGVKLYGGFAGTETLLSERDWKSNLSILDGQSAGSVITVESGADENTRIDGLVIQNGSGEAGAGIQSIAASPVIANNWIHNNVATNGGGGIYIADCSALVVSNRVEDNLALIEFTAAGGGICSSNCSSLITSNVIVRNTAYFGGGVRCWEGTQTISKNVVSGNHARQLAGGIEVAAASVVIEGNRIIGNVALYGSGGAGGGVSVWGSAETTIRNNLMMANSTSGNGGAIYAATGPGYRLNLINNTIVDNYGWARTSGVPEHWGPSIYIEGDEFVGVNNIIAFGSGGAWIGAGAEWRNNCVYGNSGPNYSGGITDPTGTDENISVDPKIGFSRESVEFHLQPGSPCIDAGSSVGIDLAMTDVDVENRVVGTEVDIGADELDGTPRVFEQTIVRVATSGDDKNDGSSWHSAKRTVQAALDQAVTSGGEVWVGKGAYFGNVKLQPLVKLFGGFAGDEQSRNERDTMINSTVLDGGGLTNVVTGDYLDMVSEVNGFVIQNGRAIQGAGLWLRRSPIEVANNRISRNHTYNGSSLQKPNAGAGIYMENSDASIVGNTIQENTAQRGAAAYVLRGTPSFQRNLIVGNQVTGNDVNGYDISAGIYLETSVDPIAIVANNSFIANETYTSDSSAFTAGVALLVNRTCNIINNTFFGNASYIVEGTSPFPGTGPGHAAIFLAADSCEIANNIFALNSLALRTAANPTQTISNNCFYGQLIANVDGLSDPSPQGGNIFLNPELVGPYLPLHISESSPCRDTGASVFVSSQWSDIDGDPRLFDAAVDIGADEFKDVVPTVANRVIYVREDGDDAADGRSWSAAKKTIQEGINTAFDMGGADIWVEKGRYKERPQIKSFAYLYGGFLGNEATNAGRDLLSNQSIIDAEYQGTAVSILAPGAYSSLDGFTIIHGQGLLAGGVYCGFGSEPLIGNNRIIGCTTPGPLSGISSLTAGRYSGGAGIRCELASPTIVNNLIISNTASHFTIFGRLYAGAGGISLTGGSDGVVANNTLVYNSAYQGIGTVGLVSSAATIHNNIFAFNSGGITTGVSSNPIIETNCFYGNASNGLIGNSPVLSDPQFLDDQATFFLAALSPCIDAGMSSVVQSGWTDAYGRSRISGNGVDIGAVEMQADDNELPVTHVPSFAVDVVGGIAYLKYERTVDGDYNGDLLPTPYLDGGTIRWNFQLTLDVNSSAPGPSFAGSIPLGTLAPGTYQFQPSSWGVPLETTQFVIPSDGSGTMGIPTLTVDGFQFSLNGVENVRYFTDQTSDFLTWQTVATTDGTNQPVVVPANLLSGRDFFRVRMEPREVSVP